MATVTPGIAVAYICRGKDENWRENATLFRDSFLKSSAGIDNQVYVILKGFDVPGEMKEATQLLSPLEYKEVHLGDDSFDIGAYIEWANQVSEDVICGLNSSSRPLCDNWLRKLWLNLNLPSVGLVGATGSYESLCGLDSCFPKFPNIHLRSTGFMIRRNFFCQLTKNCKIETKLDAYKFESGPESLTRKVLDAGKKVFVVGRNGRGYSPAYWRVSDTFRQGVQTNLLIGDNQTRNFDKYVWADRYTVMQNTFGDQSVNLSKTLNA